jgi:hypothetical protein
MKTTHYHIAISYFPIPALPNPIYLESYNKIIQYFDMSLLSQFFVNRNVTKFSNVEPPDDKTEQYFGANFKISRKWLRESHPPPV